MNIDETSCPFCLETIKAGAIRCKHCHADLSGTPSVTPVTMKLSGKVPPVVITERKRYKSERADLTFLEEREVADVLSALIDKSLVVRDETTNRYRLLETVRQYGIERLRDIEEASGIRARHLDYFLGLAEEAEPQLTGSDQVEWLERLEIEHENLRSALEWSPGNPTIADAELRLSGALWRFWLVRGHTSEARMHLHAALDRNGAEVRNKERALALNGAANAAKWQGDYDDAWALFDESLAIRRELGDRLGIARSIGNLGTISNVLGDYASAQSLQEESLAISRELGDRWGIALSLGNLGKNAYCIGDYLAARAFQEESLAVFTDLNYRWGIANALSNLGDLSLEQGELAAARAFQQESLRIFMELGERWGIAEALKGIAAAACEPGSWELAAKLWGTADALREVIGSPLDPEEREKQELGIAGARDALGDEAFVTAWTEGRALSMEQAIEQALRAQEI